MCEKIYMNQWKQRADIFGSGRDEETVPKYANDNPSQRNP
jgi:hypothetical protein